MPHFKRAAEVGLLSWCDCLCFRLGSQKSSPLVRRQQNSLDIRNRATRRELTIPSADFEQILFDQVRGLHKYHG